MDTETTLDEHWDMDKLRQLLAERDAMEKEIAALQSSLTGPGGPGLIGGLVDKEGFPIADFEKIIAVRESRQRLACLQNDYKILMNRIEIGLIELHRHARESGQVVEGSSSASSSSSGSSGTKAADPYLAKKPFTRVQSVSAGSPAEQAGLHVGDLIIEFGSASLDSSSNPMVSVRDIVAHSENRQVDLVVRRGDSIERIALTPRKWSGAGLLGCHVVPV